jgi:hypothetical protein
MTATRPVLPLTGGCSCGAIRYEITAFPLLLYSCNCSNCQTASGAAFALNMPVTTKSLRIIKGEPKGWHHLSPSGAEVCSWFCGDCGARLYGSRKSRPQSMNLRAGTLDDTDWLVPVVHTFLESGQPWIRSLVRSAVDVECYETSPPDYEQLGRKWRAMWPEFFPPK